MPDSQPRDFSCAVCRVLMVHAGTCPMGEECPENVGYILLRVSGSSTSVLSLCLVFCWLLGGALTLRFRPGPGSVCLSLRMSVFGSRPLQRVRCAFRRHARPSSVWSSCSSLKGAATRRGAGQATLRPALECPASSAFVFSDEKFALVLIASPPWAKPRFSLAAVLFLFLFVFSFQKFDSDVSPGGFLWV